MQYKNFDYIILGGGCSALSLASQISDKNINKYSFLILESRIKYKDDRSWCFWSEKKNSFNNLISYSWKNFSFSLKNKKIVHSSKKYNYKYIRSIDFYKTALKKIKKTSYITLNLGERVEKVNLNKDKYIVNTNKKKYLAKNIIDTRPKKNIYLEDPFLYQSFVGYEIKVKGHMPHFNLAKIMDNMRYESNLFIFDYILPFENNVILIEATSFSKKIVPINTLKLILKNTMKKHKITNYKIIRQEYGVIPMGFIDKTRLPKRKNYYYAGSLGGAIRPSSGYAFLRIQRWATKCSSMLKNDKKLISHPKEKLITRELDMIFLKTLTNNLSLAPSIFFIFLSRISTNSFIRFMSGNANFIDYFKIILSMPKKIFLKAITFTDYRK